ncbi:MAG: DUF6483 family protein, partial [Anaerolineae bacterium]|nr:DUF6483 family protein [Anaerolineae bacterium]
MFHRDYIMRQIIQLVEVFQRIVGLTKGGQFEAALSIIDHELEQLLGLNSGAVAKIGSRSLIAFATFDDRQPVDNAKQAAAAGLLRQAGAIYALQGRDDDSYACYLSALDLLLDARLDAPDLAFPEITPPVEALTAVLDYYLLPRDTIARLMQYFEQVGAF